MIFNKTGDRAVQRIEPRKVHATWRRMDMPTWGILVLILFRESFGQNVYYVVSTIAEAC
jgi:hypothetical protein